MGSTDGADPSPAAVIAELEGKLAAAAEKANEDSVALAAPAAGQGAVHPGRGGDGTPPAAGGAGRVDKEGGRWATGSGRDSPPAVAADAGGSGGGGGPVAPPSSSSSNGEPDGGSGGWSNIKINKPGVYLNDFEIPRRAVRADGLPVTFEPHDVGFLSAFADNARDRMEGAALYQVCYWLQEAVNEATDTYYGHTDFSPAELETCLHTLTIYLTRIHRIAVKRDDFLEAKQSDPLLARQYERFDPPAANQHRGFWMRAFRQQRDEYRARNAAKIAAYQSATDAPLKSPSAPKCDKAVKPAKPGGGGGGGGHRPGGGKADAGPGRLRDPRAEGGGGGGGGGGGAGQPRGGR